MPTPDQQSQAAELLRRATAHPKASIQRKLLLSAAFATAALDHAVLVGGVAADIHTGSYRPTDIDLVGYRRPDTTQSLNDLGFQKEGRHWLHQFADGERLAIEVPADQLGDFATEPPQIIDLDPGELAVISLNDLMMDRLLQATGGEPVTFDEAVRLAIAAYPHIAWPDLDERAKAAAKEGSLAGRQLPDTLTRVRRAALSLLRKERGQSPTTDPNA
jgi:hypothetical protein